MNPSTITRHLVTALVMVIALLWAWATVAHAQSSTTTIRGAGLQPLVEETGSSQTLNIYGPGGAIIAQVATNSPAGGTPTTQTRYLLHDHLGSTRVVLDSNNQVLGSFDYSPFGETTVSNGAAGNVADVAYRYTGQEVNEALGTYNYHARQYDAGMGRFLRVDPARYNANPYLYANDNPVNFVDQTGRQPTLWLVSRDRLKSNSQFKIMMDLRTLTTKLNIPLEFGSLESQGLFGRVPQGNLSLVIEAHGNPNGFGFQTDRLGLVTPENFAESVYHRFIQENLQLEAVTSILLATCRSGCERNGVSAAERFFQHGLERFPNLERVIASPYSIHVSVTGRQVRLRFFSAIESEPERKIGLTTSYDPQRFFHQEIDETVLRENISRMRYMRAAGNHRLTPMEEIPHIYHRGTLEQRFPTPLFRTYTRSSVQQRTLRELPFFSAEELP